MKSYSEITVKHILTIDLNDFIFMFLLQKFD